MKAPTPRSRPSIFLPWHGINQTDLGDETDEEKIARHDLAWLSDMGLRSVAPNDWLNPHFTPESIQAAVALKERLLGLNPNLVLLHNCHYTDAYVGQLPDNHPFWKRVNGALVQVWKDVNGAWTYALDLHNTQYQDVIAQRALAAMQTGAGAGILLDWWLDDADHLAIIRKIRAAIGEQALIVGNGNKRICPLTIGYLNGVFEECGQLKTTKDWEDTIRAVDFNEAHVRSPKINCLEINWLNSRDDFSLMRAATCLGLTHHRDGYILFDDPNFLPAKDHGHSWYRFWNKTLGLPIGGLVIGSDGLHRRSFEKGTAVFCPPGFENYHIVRFESPMTSVVSGRTSDYFSLPSPGGGIYLYPTNTTASMGVNTPVQLPHNPEAEYGVIGSMIGILQTPPRLWV